jgi:hypothetical protein
MDAAHAAAAGHAAAVRPAARDGIVRRTLGTPAAKLERVIDKRTQADRILVAQLTGEAKHHAGWRDPTGDEEAAAVAELRELAGGRPDLLAEVAGIFEGTSEGEPDEPRARQAAALCRKSGADPEAIPAWIEEGRRRRAAARRSLGSPRPGRRSRPCRRSRRPEPAVRPAL